MFDRLLAVVGRIFEAMIAILFFAIVVVGGLQVFNRFVLNQSLSWSEEFMVYGNIWMVFLAIPVAYRRGSHIGMDLFVKSFPRKAQIGMSLAIDLLWLVLATVIVIYSTVVMGVAKHQASPAMGLRMDWPYLSLVVAWSYMGLLALQRVGGSVARLRAAGVAGGAPC